MRFFRALAASFSYFSIFPSKTFDVAADGDAIAVLPLVGLVIGALAGGCAYGTFLLTHSSVAAAIVAWVASIALSGAIHVDGFLDCCDGLFAMVSPERRLEIMRDPHHGTYAIVGMALLSVVWLYALLQIDPRTFPLTLALLGGLARGFGAGKSKVGTSIAGLIAGCGVYLLHSVWRAGVILLIAFVVAACAGAFMRKRINGPLNGDCRGTLIVVTEVALLLAVPFLKLLP